MILRRAVFAGAGTLALVASLWLPAVSAGGTWSGLELLTQGAPRALGRLCDGGASISSRLIALCSLVAMSANLALPILAFRPSLWRAGLALGLLVLGAGVALHLSQTSPLQFRSGSALWFGGAALLVLAAWPVGGLTASHKDR